jgi:phage shock protein PspC (stress-responsive transcriptional regulator)
MSVADEIEKLAQLRASGALTEEEFQRAKARLLDGDSDRFASASSSYTGQAFSSQHPLRRSTSDVWLGGVCGGLGQFTGLESWVWRLIFIIGLLGGGVSILAYVLLWIFVPRAV